MNVANNHALDFGPVGQAQTLAALRKVGLAWTGRPGEIAYQQVGAIRVALLGFAPYKWAQSLTDIPAARRLVRKAAANADVVVVTMHAGAEGVDHQHVTPGMETYLGETRGNPIAFSHAVVNAGADLVVGSGPHVLRGMEWYKGRLIAYSLGNFGGYKVFRLGGPLSTSGILHVTLRGGRELRQGRPRRDQARRGRDPGARQVRGRAPARPHAVAAGPRRPRGHGLLDGPPALAASASARTARRRRAAPASSPPRPRGRPRRSRPATQWLTCASRIWKARLSSAVLTAAICVRMSMQ